MASERKRNGFHALICQQTIDSQLSGCRSQCYVSLHSYTINQRKDFFECNIFHLFLVAFNCLIIYIYRIIVLVSFVTLT